MITTNKITSYFTLTIVFIFNFFSLVTQAQEISIVDVKRNITLSDEDLVYKDYYINAGSSSALRKNMVVNVRRKISIKDSGTKTIGDFETVVGQLKIIHIGNKVSVGREHKLIPRDEEPMLEQIGIMSGDRLDLKDSFIDNSKPVHRHKTAEAEPQKPAEETKSEREPANEIKLIPNAPPKSPQATPIPQI